MRYQDQPLPSKDESRIETQKRLDILDRIKPELEKFCEIVIVAGSVGYGKNFSVRKESDLDLIILINRENIKEIFNSSLFKITSQIKEAVSYFKGKRVLLTFQNGFNLDGVIDKVFSESVIFRTKQKTSAIAMQDIKSLVESDY